MNPSPQAIWSAQRSRLSRQLQLLYKLDEHGHRIYDESTGEQIVDLNRAPAVLADVGVPRRMAEATFASAEFADAENVKQWYADVLAGMDVGHLGLIMGNGSSYVAAAALRTAVRRGKTVAWYSWHDFTSRYTDAIDRSRLLSSGNAEEMSVAATETDDAREEDFRLSHVYEVLALTAFDLNDVRDFAVPEIIALLTARIDADLVTIITVSAANSGPLEEPAHRFGARGSLLRKFEDEAVVIDGRE